MLTAQPITIELSGDWFSAWVNFFMLIVAVVSAIYAYRAYNHQKVRSKKEAACNLAKYYAEVILEESSLVSNVFDISGLDDYIKQTICLNDIVAFDRDEIDRLLAKKNIPSEEFFKKIGAVDPVVILNCRFARTYSMQEREAALKDIIYTDPETGEKRLRNAPFVINFFMQELSNLLNQLEWFSMNCRYGLADEELLYQSLHQTFLSAVWVMYPYICENNCCNEDKHFTNVAWLFNTWHSRLCEIKQKAEEKKNKYLRMADSVKPEIFSGRGIK